MIASQIYVGEETVVSSHESTNSVQSLFPSSPNTSNDALTPPKTQFNPPMESPCSTHCSTTFDANQQQQGCSSPVSRSEGVTNAVTPDTPTTPTTPATPATPATPLTPMTPFVNQTYASCSYDTPLHDSYLKSKHSPDQKSSLSFHNATPKSSVTRQSPSRMPYQTQTTCSSPMTKLVEQVSNMSISPPSSSSSQKLQLSSPMLTLQPQDEVGQENDEDEDVSFSPILNDPKYTQSPELHNFNKNDVHRDHDHLQYSMHSKKRVFMNMKGSSSSVTPPQKERKSVRHSQPSSAACSSGLEESLERYMSMLSSSDSPVLSTEQAFNSLNYGNLGKFIPHSCIMYLLCYFDISIIY